MSPITIHLPDDRAAKLRELAVNLGIALEDLVRLSIEDLLSKPAEDCQQAIDHILNKNKDLYERLS